MVPPTFTPQSTSTLDLGVSTSIHDRPTSLKPPSIITRIQYLFVLRSLKIFFPISFKNFLRNFTSLCMTLRIPDIISDFIEGTRSIRGIQSDSALMRRKVSPPRPITRPGFSAAIITMLRSGSKYISFIFASSGTISFIFFFVYSWSFVRLLSGLISIRFFSLFTSSFTGSSWERKKFSLFVYTMISEPSSSILLTTSFGRPSLTFSIISIFSFFAMKSLL